MFYLFHARQSGWIFKIQFTYMVSYHKIFCTRIIDDGSALPSQNMQCIFVELWTNVVNLECIDHVIFDAHLLIELHSAALYAMHIWNSKL